MYYRDEDGKQREAPNGGLYTVTMEHKKTKNDYYYALQKYKSGEQLYHVNGKHLLERSKQIPKGTTVRVQNADGIHTTVRVSNGEIKNNKELTVIQYEREHKKDGERLYTLEDPSTEIRYTRVKEKHLHPIQSRSVTKKDPVKSPRHVVLKRSKQIPVGTRVRVQNADGIHTTVRAFKGEIENNKVLKVIQYEGKHKEDGQRLYTLKDPSTKIRYTSVKEKHLHPIQSLNVPSSDDVSKRSLGKFLAPMASHQVDGLYYDVDGYFTQSKGRTVKSSHVVKLLTGEYATVLGYEQAKGVTVSLAKTGENMVIALKIETNTTMKAIRAPFAGIFSSGFM